MSRVSCADVVAVADAVHAEDPEPVDQRDQQRCRTPGRPSRRARWRGSARKPRWRRLCRLGSSLRQMPPLLKPSNVVVPISVQIKATVPRRIGRSVTPLSEPAQADVRRRSSRVNAESLRDQVEIDAESVRLFAPLLHAEQQHPGEHHQEVAERQRRQRRGPVAFDVDQLEPGEADDRRRPRATSRATPGSAAAASAGRRGARAGAAPSARARTCATG